MWIKQNDMKLFFTSLFSIILTCNLFAATDKPNVIIFITDDQGYGDLSAHGNPILKTPNLDKFRSESIALTNFHTGPTCAPTRAGLLTGRNCNKNGLWHTITQRAMLRTSAKTLPEILRENGYSTGIFGKWHLGDATGYTPFDRGFESGVYHAAGGVGQTSDYFGNDYFDDTYITKNGLKKFDGYCTDVWVDEAIKFIAQESQNAKPFFCYISTNAPHTPLNVAEEYSKIYEGKVPADMAKFYGMISNIDDNFLKLENALKKLNLHKNTIVIFMTDNGTGSGVIFDKSGNILAGYNANLRAKKGSPYEGGHRVPCFIKHPKLSEIQGLEVGLLTSHLDILPTILEFCGIDYDSNLDGVSLCKIFEKKNPHKKYFEDRIIVVDSQRDLNAKKWKSSAVMKANWRLINGAELYNLENDFSQKNNVAKEYPQIFAELKNAYEDWFAETFTEENSKLNLFYIDSKLSDFPATLDSHSWQPNTSSDGCLWNQEQIKEGLSWNGYWQIDVKEDGVYTFEMRRWPKESDTEIRGAPKEFPNAKNLDILSAKLQIDDSFQECSVAESDKFSKFICKLSKGEHRIQTYFSTKEYDIGAYYVYIKKTE